MRTTTSEDRTLRKQSEEYYQQLFGGIKTGKTDEKYGDLYIKYNNSLIYFEVSTPLYSPSISTKKLIENTYKCEEIKGKTCESMGGGLSKERLNESIEKILENKNKQFSKEIVNFKKVLIINLRCGKFTGVENLHQEEKCSKSLNKYCSAVLVDGSFNKNIIMNNVAKFPLNNKEEEFIWEKFNMSCLMYFSTSNCIDSK